MIFQLLNQLLLSVPSGSRDLVEFFVFVTIGITAGTFGII
tara:strand:- start:223 stop:342 length:120 start_codon:yes stop_codon:yes gene_type:complete